MKVRLLKKEIFFLIGSVLLLVSCLGKNNYDDKQAEVERNNVTLRKDFADVQGVYSGEFITNDIKKGPLKAEIVVYVDTVQDGIDSNGAPKSRPFLKAQFKLTDTVGELDDHNFIVDYRPMTGDVYFTQGVNVGGASGGSSGAGGASITACSVGPRDPALAIEAKLQQGNSLVGPVKGSNGIIGQIQVKRTTETALSPVTDQRERLLTSYNQLTGVYEGSLLTAKGKAQIKIYLMRDDQLVTPNLSCPVLKAQFRMEDVVGELDDQNFEVSYRGGTQEITLTPIKTSSSTAQCALGPKDPQLSATGVLSSEGAFSGKLRGTQGPIGNFTLQRSSDNSLVPLHDERARILAVYQKILGTYDGDYVTTYGQFKARLIISLKEEATGDSSLTCPALRTHFRLIDTVGELDDHTLNALYRPLTGELFMTPQVGGNSGSDGNRVCSLGPKDQKLSINAKILNNKVEGKIQGTAGLMGEIHFLKTSEKYEAPDDQKERILQAYKKLSGIYSGDLDMARGKTGMSLYVFPSDEAISSNLSCPILKAQFRLTEVINELDDHNLEVSVRPSTGELIFTPPKDNSNSLVGRTCSLGPRDLRLSIDAKLVNNELKGSVRGSDGSIGEFTNTRISEQASLPLRDQRDRLLQALERVKGTYQGTLGYAGKQSLNFQTRMIINHVDVTENGITCPVLTANFALTDVVGELDDHNMIVSYRPLTKEIYMSVNPNSSSQSATQSRVCPTGVYDGKLSLQGELKEFLLEDTKDQKKAKDLKNPKNVIEAKDAIEAKEKNYSYSLSGGLKGSDGFIGQLNLKRISNSTNVPIDQRERISKSYSSVAGVYLGKFNTNPKPLGACFEVTMGEQMLAGYVVCPILKAQYVRPDLPDHIGSMALSVQYYPGRSSIVMKSTSQGASGHEVPGALDLSVSGQITSSKLEGDMQWWNYSGLVSAKRRNDLKKCPVPGK